jgi:predicted amino acid racemase
MTGPWLSIDLDKIERNSRALVELCAQHGIAVTGVTKATCGNPEVAKAMLRGGVCSIADSRLDNIHRLKAAGIDTSYMLLRLPPLSGTNTVVDSVDISLNSELSVLQGLSAAARKTGVEHDVIIMIDLGDLREGILPDDLMPFMQEATRLAGIRIVGIGVSLACISGVVPDESNMSRLVELADAVEQSFDLKLKWISGANSSGLELIASGRMPRRVNHARIGEAILLGRETVHRSPWPGTFQDALVLHAEVLELRNKPSMPIGTRSEDAFGKRPWFEDRGVISRALLNVGREDIDAEGITPVDARFRIIGASSDYLAVDVSAAGNDVRVGDCLAFSLNYSALVAAMTSAYVKKCPEQGGVYGRGSCD